MKKLLTILICGVFFVSCGKIGDSLLENNKNFNETTSNPFIMENDKLIELDEYKN